MFIFIDYDNIDFTITRLGVHHIISKIISRIDPREVSSGNRVLARLYGGWYENNNFTRRAQILSTDIRSSFPSVLTLSDNTTQVIVNCELAFSMLADPTNHLFHTYRPRGIPEGLKVLHPKTVGCNDPKCPLVTTYDFITNDVCNLCGNIRPRDLFYRGEQKLVDTMLTSDLIYSVNQPSNLCIVSSDDDFWPGIITTLNMGKRVVQLHTRNRQTPGFYTRNAGNNYIQKLL
jgi:uncharacterized LabA/DUF88 family protein